MTSEAKKLLIEQPELTVLRLSMITGFSSMRAFNRFFAEITGLRPVEYRIKNHQTDKHILQSK